MELLTSVLFSQGLLASPPLLPRQPTVDFDELLLFDSQISGAHDDIRWNEEIVNRLSDGVKQALKVKNVAYEFVQLQGVQTCIFWVFGNIVSGEGSCFKFWAFF